MSFDSGTFWVLFGLSWLLWWRLPFSWAKTAALAASLIFYAWWSPYYLPLIIISAVVDYAAGGRIHAARSDGARTRWLLVSLCTNLGLLGYFKYGHFALENLDSIAGALGVEGVNTAIPWVVPVGISFYTFQTLSYSIDIYRGRLAPAKSFRDFFLFVAFFPQLVAGPIVRAQELLPQFRRRQWPSPWRIQNGLYLIVWGLFTKIVVADNLAPEIDRIFAMIPSGQATPAHVWLSLIYLGCMVFADFAGYSCLAIGLACLLGMRFPRNFLYPYISRGPQELWVRWHMTLSSWLRDYVYMPLWGKKGGGGRQYTAMLTTMVLAGVWHGAAWTFVMFGLYHGIGVVVNRFWVNTFNGGRRARGWPFDRPKGPAAITKRIGIILLMNVFMQSNWVFFRAPDVASVFEVWRIAYIVPFQKGMGWEVFAEARHLVLVLPIVLMHVTQLLREWFAWRERPWHRVLAAAVMIVALVVVRRTDTADFFYFQF
ncbi:MBOAT family protein [Planctomycetota bacterium]|jgi:alginate O-acetyltransferase complex protein AlgI|nr:MBOAT family protein [Planctomycetota bacterium]